MRTSPPPVWMWESWVRSLGPDWKEVGKVGFHLAENRNDRDGTHPFLFLATFIHRPGEGEKPRHLPLGAALKAFARRAGRVADSAPSGPAGCGIIGADRGADRR